MKWYKKYKTSVSIEGNLISILSSDPKFKNLLDYLLLHTNKTIQNLTDLNFLLIKREDNESDESNLSDRYENNFGVSLGDPKKDSNIITDSEPNIDSAIQNAVVRIPFII